MALPHTSLPWVRYYCLRLRQHILSYENCHVSFSKVEQSLFCFSLLTNLRYMVIIWSPNKGLSLYDVIPKFWIFFYIIWHGVARSKILATTEQSKFDWKYAPSLVSCSDLHPADQTTCLPLVRFGSVRNEKTSWYTDWSGRCFAWPT